MPDQHHRRDLQERLGQARWLALAGLLCPLSALGQEAGFDTQRPVGSAAGDRFMLVPDATSFSGARVQPGLRMTTGYDLTPSNRFIDDDLPVVNATARMGLAFTVLKRLNIDADLPVRTTDFRSVDLYDAQIRARGTLFGDTESALALAIDAAAWLPTGDPASFTGDPDARYMGRVIASGDPGRFQYATSWGYQHRTYQAGEELLVGPSVLFGVAAGGEVVEGLLYLGGEVAGHTVVPDEAQAVRFLDSRASPIEGRLTSRVTLGRAEVGLSVGSGLTRTPGTPGLTVGTSLTWEPPVGFPDIDGDGIADDDDLCPSEAGVRTASGEGMGCPLDSDRDGIADITDECPAMAGDGADGCPLDSDEDGVFDMFDACVDEAGPSSPIEDRRGCPLPVIAVEVGMPSAGDALSAELADVAAILRDYPELSQLVIAATGTTDEEARAHAETIRAWLAIDGGVHAHRLRVEATRGETAVARLYTPEQL